MRRHAYPSLVGFVVGEVTYAVPTPCVREITTPAALTELPKLPQSVLGVFEHRGLVVPVIDLRRRFDVASSQPPTRTQWVIVDAGQHRMGLAVDRVTGVFEVALGSLKPVPEMGSPVHPRQLAGVTSQDGKMTFVLDVGAFHTSALEVALPELSAG